MSVSGGTAIITVNTVKGICDDNLQICHWDAFSSGKPWRHCAFRRGPPDEKNARALRLIGHLPLPDDTDADRWATTGRM